LEDGQDLEFPVDLLDHLHRRNTASLSLTSHSILWPSILPTLETVDYVEMKRILDPEFIDPSCSPSPIYEGANRTIQLVVDGSQGESREDPWYRGRTSAVLRDLLSSVTDYLRGQRLSKDCVFFWAEHKEGSERGGTIGFAPINTMVGDKLCKLPDTTVSCISRRDGRKLKVMGRAANVFTTSISTYKGTVRYDIDVPTLQLLSI
jgi:hypothetical protein